MDFKEQKDIYLGISEKKDASLKNAPAACLAFFNHKNLKPKIIVSASLEHGNQVMVVDNINKNKNIYHCDALITNQPNFLLTITVADCLPLYFYDENKKVVAIAHAGWRGVVLNIAQQVIHAFVNSYQSDLKDIKVYIGPHIQACHFSVKEDVARKFNKENISCHDKKIFVNLAQTVAGQLATSGIPTQNINISSECTYCLADKYFSFRRDKPKTVEAMLAHICLK
jgi:hypothetical protein